MCFTREQEGLTRAGGPKGHQERELPLIVAAFPSDYGRQVGEPAWEEFIRALAAASPYFAGLRASGVVAHHRDRG
ncbi:hypothetical protein [Streptomyces sp. NPDC006012]|uniref:hypothetical protein n=1 Tax=Streptomyces sp. NPDC006012 TaxID=3364739 RepID=UPI003680B444